MPTSDFGSVYFLGFAIVVYLIATVLYILYAIFRNEGVGKVATWILGIGLLGQTVALVLKTLELGYAPFVTVYGTLVFWSWLIVLIYLLFQFRFRIRLLGAIVAPLAFLAIAPASLLSRQASPLVPALRSGWLSLHDVLDMIGYRSISIGFPFLTLGIIAGAVWANAAWGSYWTRDPKENWSLITWFIYAVYLLLRIVGACKGKSSAIVAIIGFAAVLFRFIK